MIIVTGGAGFIGSVLVEKLNSEGVKDIVIVDNLGTSEKWRNLVGRSFREYIHRDKFLDLLTSGKLSTSIDAIFHLGACSRTTERDVDFLMENNVRYSKTLAEYALLNGIRFIYASSAATYGDGTQGYRDDEDSILNLRPLNPYGYSKQLFDLWCLRQRVFDRVAGLKFFNVYGPNENHKTGMLSIVRQAFNQIQASGTVKLFKSYRPEYADGEQKRDFIYVKDCISIMWWLFENRQANGLFNVGTGHAETWNTMTKEVFKALGKNPKIEYIEMPDQLRGQYQYFTEAPMKKLRDAGYQVPFTPVGVAVSDYVQNYLQKNVYL